VAVDGVRLDLLGGLEIRTEAGVAIPLAARKAAALLAYLALHPGRPQSRERLAGLFWEGSAEAQARTSLRQALALLRRDVPGFRAALRAAGDAVALRPGWAGTDVAAFEAAAAAPDLLARAASLYRGELLAGLRLRSAAFDAWLLPERARLHGRAIAAMRALLDQEGGDAEERVALALRLLQLDPAQEEVHRAMIRLHARRGRHEAALRQFQACREALRRELDVAPDAETERLVREIRARRAATAAGAAGGGAASAPPVGRPAEPVAFGCRWPPAGAMGSFESADDGRRLAPAPRRRGRHRSAVR
jgi:DNA-binding SARP family transcriptional activator